MELRPRIGICTNLEQAQWGVWDQQTALLPFSYVTAVQRAGGIVLMIPPDPELVNDPDQVLDILHGLVLAGGADLDPASYGAERSPHTRHTVPERDATELALTRRAIERDIPTLGICRGMQLMNVACGGTLHQHLPELLGHEHHRRHPGTFEGADHPVQLAPDSLAARAAGEIEHRTLSHHHQGIDELGEGLRVTGHSILDELPEAIEAPGRRYVLGVQWHPEADETSTIVDSLVAEAAAYRRARLATT